MDLKKKFDSITNADKGMKLILQAKTATEEEAGLVMYGADSAVYRAKEKEIAVRNRERKSALTVDDAEAQLYERLVAATKSSYGLEEDGKTFDFKPENGEAFYRRYPEIMSLASNFFTDRANFFMTASGS